MSKYVIIGVLIIGVGLVSYMGCDGAKARLGVAGDKAIEQIDKLLGEINVKKKKVENAYAELQEVVETVRAKKIEAEVRLKQLSEKKAELDEKKEGLKKDLVKLNGLLKEANGSETVSYKDNEIPVEKLKTTAEAKIKEMRSVQDQVKKNEVISNAWAKNLSVLKKQYETSDTQLKKLDDQLAEIESKKSSLDAMKEAATIAGPGASISDKFNDLTAEVDELLVNLDTEFQIEEAKLDERMSQLTSETSIDLEEVLTDKTDVSGTTAEIDKILAEDGDE